MRLIDTIKQFIKRIYKKDNTSYLDKLVYQLEEKQKENLVIPFYIKKAKKKGFLVKVQGLFAYVSFSHMPWKYSTHDNWKFAAKFLINKKFYCTINKIARDPLSINIDATAHLFKKTTLYNDADYDGIVINKVDYGIFVDIGYHFNWQYGSMVGLIYKAKDEKSSSFRKVKKGEVIEVTFREYKDDKISLRYPLLEKEREQRKKQEQKELAFRNTYLGTTQNVRVRGRVLSERVYLLNDKEPVRILTSQKYYPKNIRKKQVEATLESLNNNEVIKCEIIDITKKGVFWVKIIFDDF